MGNSTRPQVIQLEKIRRDCGTQQRARLDQSVVEDYAERIKAKAELPPVDIYKIATDDGFDFVLADGFHRVEAAELAGQKAVPYTLYEGTLRDAILHSIKANHHHGLRRTNEDKRFAVTTLLADSEWHQWSDGKLADVAGVSQNFVRSVRSELSTKCSSQPAKRIGKDGKARPVNRKVSTKKPTPACHDDGPAENLLSESHPLYGEMNAKVLRVIRAGELGGESDPSDAFIARALNVGIEFVANLREADKCRNCGGSLRDDDLDCVACHEPFAPETAPVKLAASTLPAPKRRTRKPKPFDAEGTLRWAEMDCDEFIWAHPWPVEYRQKLSELFTRLAEKALTYDPEQDEESPWYKPAETINSFCPTTEAAS